MDLVNWIMSSFLCICVLVLFYLIGTLFYSMPCIFIFINKLLHRYTLIITDVEFKFSKNEPNNKLVYYYNLGYNNWRKRYEIFPRVTSDDFTTLLNSTYDKTKVEEFITSYENDLALGSKGGKQFYINLQKFDNKVFLNEHIVGLYIDKNAQLKELKEMEAHQSHGKNETHIALEQDFSVHTFDKKVQYTAMKIAANR